MTKSSPTRTEPKGSRSVASPLYHHWAEEFIQAARQLVGPMTRSFPRYVLLGYAVELSLKTFLITCGTNDKKLRRMGHDLRKALNRAKNSGLLDVVDVGQEVERALEELNRNFEVSSDGRPLIYPVAHRYYSLPDPEILIGFAEIVLSAATKRGDTIVYEDGRTLGPF